jgi:hypothetical protein
LTSKPNGGAPNSGLRFHGLIMDGVAVSYNEVVVVVEEEDDDDDDVYG